MNELFNKKSAFIAYITAGDGGLKYTREAAIALAEGGVDILEIGLPFSDPTADGPVIQRAMNRALQEEITLFDVLAVVKEVKQAIDIPIILFTYYNPLFNAIENDVFRKAKEAGVNGILVVDLPIEESNEYYHHCIQNKIDPIYIITPSTPLDRIKKIEKKRSAFLYYVCRKGTTGIKNSLPNDFEKNMRQIKQVTQTPVVAGFGISNKQTAATVLSHADGFVVGSLFVKAIEEGASPNDLTKLAIQLDPR